MEALLVLIGTLTVVYAGMLIWMAIPNKEKKYDAK